MNQARRLPSTIVPIILCGALFVAVSNCTVEPIELESKTCPCAAGWTCDTATNRCVHDLPPGDGAADAADGTVGHGNDASLDGGPRDPEDASSIADAADASPASDAADANSLPSTDGGLADAADAGTRCAVSSSDQWLYCTNRPSAIYDGPSTTGTTIVDSLLSNYTAFDCWHFGEYHKGMNFTWYHTKGGQFGRWGYVPAYHLDTSSVFDAHPNDYGLQQCVTDAGTPQADAAASD
jgi:hypothetical protein